jgi:hypothetical protein
MNVHVHIIHIHLEHVGNIIIGDGGGVSGTVTTMHVYGIFIYLFFYPARLQIALTIKPLISSHPWWSGLVWSGSSGVVIRFSCGDIVPFLPSFLALYPSCSANVS